jgi:excisionase family DNA binding protein
MVTDVCLSLAGGSALPAPLHLISSSDWQRALPFLGTLTLDAVKRKTGKVGGLDHAEDAAAVVTAAVAVVQAWPAGFEALLHAALASHRPTASLQRAFDPVYRVIYRRLAGPAFDFMREAFEGFLREHWWGVVCKRNRRLQPTVIESRRRLTVPQAAKVTGIPRSVIGHLVEQGELDVTVVEQPCGRHWRSVSADQVARLDGAAQFCSLKQAAARLALPESRVRELIAIEEIKPLVSRRQATASASWVIPLRELARLEIPCVPAFGATISVRDFLRYARLSPAELGSLFAGLRCGALAPMADGEQPVAIGLVLMDAGAAWAWIRARRGCPNEGISVDQAARALGLKQEVTYSLVRSGLLRSRADAAGHRRVSRADVEQFRATYVSLAVLATRAHRAPRALLTEIHATPVAGPGVDGSRQYFFRLADVILQQPESEATDGER